MDTEADTGLTIAVVGVVRESIRPGPHVARWAFDDDPRLRRQTTLPNELDEQRGHRFDVGVGCIAEDEVESAYRLNLGYGGWWS